MIVDAMAVAPPPAATGDNVWFALSGEDVASDFGVDTHAGLDAEEAARRLVQYGPNALVATEGEPRWHLRRPRLWRLHL